jgi:hypothetical protein
LTLEKIIAKGREFFNIFRNTKSSIAHAYVGVGGCFSKSAQIEDLTIRVPNSFSTVP